MAEEQVSLEAFLGELEEIFQQRQKCYDMKAAYEAESKKLTEMKLSALKKMEAAGIDQQKIPGVGTFSRTKKHSVAVPKDHEAKEALWGYIKDRYGEDTLADYQTINSKRLQSFYASEYARAAEEGDIDWSLPGVPEPKVYYDLGIRKA